MSNENPFIYMQRTISMLTMLLGKTITLLVLASSVVNADRNHDDDTIGIHKDEHTGYTFVVDDLVWLTFIMLMVILISWACCFVYPDTPPQPPPCRQCPSACNPVIHVKIDDPCARQYRKKNDNNAFTPKSFDEGDPTAPHTAQTDCF